MCGGAGGERERRQQKVEALGSGVCGEFGSQSGLRRVDGPSMEQN